MSNLVRPAVSLFLLLSVITGVAYPLAVTCTAQTFFPVQAAGSLIVRDGRVVGSRLIGQNFAEPKYFWSRPSATSPMPYNAANSGGSNLGPLNPALVDGVKERIDALRAADPANDKPIPVDLVTASGSGLDPHISVDAALYQLDRVARIRHLSHQLVRNLINQHTESAMFGLFGEARINVLELNLELDQVAPL
ncbi:MAG TPA: potassium-transporting ATPase subunit KdpC [Aquabacterium sp.]|nr:potassium-transporting ATPase subunit KdpC [Aquabacterium sp.]